MSEQLTLFGPSTAENRKPRPLKGGSQNPIVFRDYDAFLAKFTDKPKTTDDCYTPKDVYEAVVEYVGTIIDLTGKEILRPFYPGGDYENAEYPQDGVVIDNPPFSMFTKICAFYTREQIPFFLFGPGLTITSCCKYCTAVVISEQITFDNGAKVKCNFASNLYGDTVITTAPALNEKIKGLPSQHQKANLTKYAYPDEVLSVSDLQTICRGGIEFSIGRGEGVIIKGLDLHPKGRGWMFGDHLLISSSKAAAKEAAKEVVHLQLSEREKKIVADLR